MEEGVDGRRVEVSRMCPCSWHGFYEPRDMFPKLCTGEVCGLGGSREYWLLYIKGKLFMYLFELILIFETGYHVSQAALKLVYKLRVNLNFR